MNQIKHNLFNLIEGFNNLDHKGLLKYIGQQEPNLLVNAANAIQAVYTMNPKGDIGEILQVIAVGEHITAIKMVRSNYGCTLREAKDAVDLFRGLPTYAEPSVLTLSILGHLNAVNKTGVNTTKTQYVHCVIKNSNGAIQGVFNDSERARGFKARLNNHVNAMDYDVVKHIVEF